MVALIPTLCETITKIFLWSGEEFRLGNSNGGVEEISQAYVVKLVVFREGFKLSMTATQAIWQEENFL